MVRDVVELLAVAALVVSMTGSGWLAWRWVRLSSTPRPHSTRLDDAVGLARALGIYTATVAMGNAFWAALVLTGFARRHGLWGPGAVVLTLLFFAMAGGQLYSGYRLDLTMRRVLR